MIALLALAAASCRHLSPQACLPFLRARDLLFSPTDNGRRKTTSAFPFTAHCPLFPRFLFYLCSSVFICGLFFCSPASATIRYTVSFAQPDQHLFRVTMVVPDVHDSLTVSLPAWNALYQIRDFAHRVG